MHWPSASPASPPYGPTEAKPIRRQGSFYDHGALHVGMQRAEVAIGPGRRKSPAVRVSGVQRRRLDLLRMVCVGDGVWDVVSVGPGHLRADLNREDWRREGEIVDRGRRIGGSGGPG